jgi:hypothetical protein
MFSGEEEEEDSLKTIRGSLELLKQRPDNLPAC